MRIVTAGMYRSGSTWQFNAVRIIMELEHGEENVYSCFWGDYKKTDKPIEVIKVQRFYEELLESSVIVTTYRDEEEIKGSMLRRKEYLEHNPDSRFQNEANVDRFDDFMWHTNKYQEVSVYTQDFDMIRNETEALIADYLELFDCKKTSVEQVIKELDRQMKVPKDGYDKKTLLHHGHITKQ